MWRVALLFGLAVLGALAAPAVAEPTTEPKAARKRSRAVVTDRVLIPAGTFLAGSPRGPLDERPGGRKRVASFRIDRTEVTRAVYARCVAARKCSASPVSAVENPDLPVTHVSWHEAQAFCAFVGGRLPREDEWEKAARGVDGRSFPWGADADCSRANWGNFDGEGPCADMNPGRPVAVGSYARGASPYGVLDLAGNVWEWVAEAYDDDPTAERRVVRGGSCCSYFVEPRAANRNAWAPDHRDGDLGFRCAYGGGRVD